MIGQNLRILQQSYYLKKLLANIFHFSQNERKGIIALAVLLLGMVAGNSLWRYIFPPEKIQYAQYRHTVSQAPLNEVADNANVSTVKQGAKAEAAKAPKQVTIIELNTADSLQLLTLNGIGPVFAGRIVKYRKLLGGFYKKEQLLEVYGFDAEKFNLVKPYISVNGNVTQLNLNTCTFKELNRHPYLDYEQVKAIFNLKKKLGSFQAVEDIKQIDLVNEELYNKLAPYLTVK